MMENVATHAKSRRSLFDNPEFIAWLVGRIHPRLTFDDERTIL